MITNVELLRRLAQSKGLPYITYDPEEIEMIFQMSDLKLIDVDRPRMAVVRRVRPRGAAMLGGDSKQA